jgi:hypothetical protein
MTGSLRDFRIDPLDCAFKLARKRQKRGAPNRWLTGEFYDRIDLANDGAELHRGHPAKASEATTAAK